jgi:hypothetical protein
MNAPIPLPDPMPLPTPQWLAWALLQLTFFVHLLAMNVVLGGSLLAAWSRIHTAGPDGAHHRRWLRLFEKAAPVAVATTVTFGVAALLFLQVLYGRLFFTSSVLMGWFWLSVVPLVIVAYYGAYLLAYQGESLGPWASRVGALVAAIFAAVAFLYVTNMTRMLRPDSFLSLWRSDGRGLHLNLHDPSFLPRYLHMLLGALAVAAIGLALLGVLRRAREPEFGLWAMRHGAVWFVATTGLNVVVGLWLLLAQPRDTLMRLAGGSAWAASLLGAGVLFGLSALGLALLAPQAPDPARWVKASGHALAATLVTMVLLRDQVRQAALDAAGFAPTPWVQPQWGPIAIFCVLLLAAGGTVAWMVLALARGRGGADAAADGVE